MAHLHADLVMSAGIQADSGKRQFPAPGSAFLRTCNAVSASLSFMIMVSFDIFRGPCGCWSVLLRQNLIMQPCQPRILYFRRHHSRSIGSAVFQKAVFQIALLLISLAADYGVVIFLRLILRDLSAQHGGGFLMLRQNQHPFHRLVKTVDNPDIGLRPPAAMYISRSILPCPRQIIGDLTHHIRLSDPGSLRGDPGRLVTHYDILILVQNPLLIHMISAFLLPHILTASCS